ncbi:hypothetical protein [Streptomyces sp. NPDC127098]|uniref:hypothetical protein n=1 Tax=Streptomyces sp. NPDC127098 TaxID=3347137 RepID=UPI00365A8C6E
MDQHTDEAVVDEAPAVEQEAKPRGGVREVLSARHALDELAAGSQELVRRATLWVASGEGWQGSARRLGAVVAGAVVAVRATGDYPIIPAVAVTGWCIAAWVLPSVPYSPGVKAPAEAGEQGQHSPDDDQVDAAGDGQELDEDGAPAAVDRDSVLQLVRDVAGDRHGAHLDDVLDAGLRSGLLTGWDKGTLRAELEGWDVPVLDQLKLRFDGRQRNRVGVRLADLPPAPERPAPAPAQPAPEAADEPVSEAPAGAVVGASPPPAPGAPQGAG